MERPAFLTDKRHYDPEFDEHEEWPDMLTGCERRPVVVDPEAARANRFASIRTVERSHGPVNADPEWRTVPRTVRREP